MFPQAPISAQPQFKSFIWGGFECTYAQVQNKVTLDLLATTEHDIRVRQDYAMMQEMGVSTVREGFAWSQIDRGDGNYNFDRFLPMLQAGADMGIQQIWDLNHFDYPADLDTLSPEFVSRFRDYAVACYRLIREYQSGTIYIAPINEISWLCWTGGLAGIWAPYLTGRDNELRLKHQCVRAVLAAQRAIWELDSDVRFIHIDPIMNRQLRPEATQREVDDLNFNNQNIRFGAWDMISGRVHPELGGSPEFLDIIGLNYYIPGQELSSSEITPEGFVHYKIMKLDDPKRKPVAEIIAEVFQRYNRPIIITETGCSFSDSRLEWWQYMKKEVEETVKLGLPLLGVCAYPVLDQPNWVPIYGRHWGIVDFGEEDLERTPDEETIGLIKELSQAVDTIQRQTK